MVVIDASLLGHAIADDGELGNHARERLRGERLIAPDLIFLEVLSLLRRGVRLRRLDQERALTAVADLATLPVETTDHRRFIPRVWELQDNVSAYDAAYVALAEERNSPLLTGDARLANATGPHCEIELIA